MDASTEQGAVSAELLAITSPGEFVKLLLNGVELRKNSSGGKSLAATLENWGDTYDGEIEGLSVKCVEREGGGEGEGEHVSRVYAVIKDGVEIAYFHSTGYYASEYGTDWDDIFTTVYPRQVVVTQYHTTKE
jgi:hypothetical protein